MLDNMTDDDDLTPDELDQLAPSFAVERRRDCPLRCVTGVI
jgi:hypothetical protein